MAKCGTSRSSQCGIPVPVAEQGHRGRYEDHPDQGRVEQHGDGESQPEELDLSDVLERRTRRAFAANATLLAGLLGAVAVAREYGHGTVVPTFLASPRRRPAVLAQLAATAIAGALVGLVGTGLTALGLAVALPNTPYGFMVSAQALAAVLAASAFAGAAGAVLGAGIGSLVRNTGGSVTGVVLVLLVGPPLLVQLFSGAASWIPSTLAMVLSGVTHEVGRPSALVALGLWAAVPAALGLLATEKRDIV